MLLELSKRLLEATKNYIFQSYVYLNKDDTDEAIINEQAMTHQKLGETFAARTKELQKGEYVIAVLPSDYHKGVLDIIGHLHDEKKKEEAIVNKYFND
jgi:hypothetical protein